MMSEMTVVNIGHKMDRTYFGLKKVDVIKALVTGAMVLLIVILVSYFENFIHLLCQS